MKIFRILFISIFLLIILLTLFSLFLPSDFTVERKIFINAKPSVVADYILDLRKWQKWTAWNKKSDSTVKFVYEGNNKGVGAIEKWDGEYFGKGRLEITKYIPGRLIEYILDMSDGGFIINGKFIFDDENNGVEVTWSGSGELSWNPMHKIFGLFMDRFLGPDYENALAKLKLICEHLK